MCDHGIAHRMEATIKKGGGLTPLMYAATNDFHVAAMYLSLRTNEIDQECPDGRNVFLVYLMKRDVDRMS